MRIDLGKLNEALYDLGQAAKLDGTLEGAPYSAGVAKEGLGDYRGAADAYAIARPPAGGAPVPDAGGARR